MLPELSGSEGPYKLFTFLALHLPISIQDMKKA
jgi:hypothetical protein